MFDFAVAGHVIPIFLLVLTGFTVGIVGGFIGVGGGYMVTPALIVFGFPGYMASGIDDCHIAGKAVIATIRHRQLGNIDWILALGHGGRHHAGRGARRPAAQLHQGPRPLRRGAPGCLGAGHARALHLHPDRDPEVAQEDSTRTERRARRSAAR